jgi:flagellar basal-body rod modification protein FlgD
MVAAVNTNPNPVSTTSTSSRTGANSAVDNMDPEKSQDRFLKLLVAQLNNQDPMNPMDNAQMTTQLAQINTVSGIQELNKTVTSLLGQFSTMQMLQGSSLVGHDVLIEGSTLTKDGNTGRGALELSEAASNVTVEVVNASGAVVDTVKLGALEAGRHTFESDLSKYASSGDLRFQVSATKGTQAVASTPLMRDKVTAVSSGANGMVIDLASHKTVNYSSVKAVL